MEEEEKFNWPLAAYSKECFTVNHFFKKPKSILLVLNKQMSQVGANTDWNVCFLVSGPTHALLLPLGLS